MFDYKCLFAKALLLENVDCLGHYFSVLEAEVVGSQKQGHVETEQEN
jgi:hypothetical protein